MDPVPATEGRAFKQEFVPGAREYWLGEVTFHLAGAGAAWLSDLSLKEAGGSAELLWEADVDRPARGTYNPLDCAMLDQLVEMAEQNSVYLMLCLIMRPKDADFKDEVACVIEQARFLRQHAPAKPALIGEFGLATPERGLSDYMKKLHG